MAIKLKVQENGPVRLNASGGDGATFNMRERIEMVATTDYEDLDNKPSINGVELVGNKTTEDLGIDVGVTSVQGETGDVILEAEISLAPWPYVGYGVVGTAFVGEEDEDTLIGTAEVGTARTDGPTADDFNYTPRGEVELTTSEASVVTGGTVALNYSYSNYKLTISGLTFTPTTETMQQVSGASFVGYPDKLIVNIGGTEE